MVGPGRTEGMPAVPGLTGVSRDQDSREERLHTTHYTHQHRHGQVQSDQPHHVCLQVSEAQQRGLHQTGPLSARLSGLRYRAGPLCEK